MIRAIKHELPLFSLQNGIPPGNKDSATPNLSKGVLAAFESPLSSLVGPSVACTNEQMAQEAMTMILNKLVMMNITGNTAHYSLDRRSGMEK